MAIYFISAFFIYLYGIVTHANKNNFRRKRFIILSFALLIIISGLRAPSVGIDISKHYARRFYEIANYSWVEVPRFSLITGYEIGYCLFTKLLTVFSTDIHLYIIVCSVLIYSSIGYFIYKTSDDVVMSVMLFIFSCLYYMFMNIMRQGLAVAIVLFGYVLLDNSNRKLKNYIVFLSMIFLASTFHESAILCVVMVIFDRLKFTRKQLLLGALAVAGIYVFYNRLYVTVLRLFGAGNNYERYLTSATEGIGNLNIQTIYNFLLTIFAFVLGYYFLVWKKKKIKTLKENEENVYQLGNRESFMLYMTLIASTCRLLIFQMNVINRFSYFFVPFMLVLYPHALSFEKSVSNRRILKSSVYVLFLIYFVWITVSYASALYGVVPYKFIWQQ